MLRIFWRCCISSKSTIGQFIFDQALSSNGLRSFIFRQLRAVLRKYFDFDRVVSTTLNGRRILINLSHELPFYRKSYPLYSANLQRLAQFVRRQSGKLCMIDVGANVGDSFTLVGKESGDSFLCVEGDSHYFELLSRNTLHNESVSLVKTFLQDKCEIKTNYLARVGGTTAVLQDDKTIPDKNITIQYCTLDEVVDNHPKFRSCNLLKVDTDGFDCRVLRGAGGVIANAKPSILFEYSPVWHMRTGDAMYQRIFSELAEWGYTVFSYYDNFGVLVTTLSIENEHIISDLISYLLHSGSYFDVCCFHDTRKSMREEFLTKEKAFYEGVQPVRVL